MPDYIIYLLADSKSRSLRYNTIIAIEFVLNYQKKKKTLIDDDDMEAEASSKVKIDVLISLCY